MGEREGGGIPEENFFVVDVAVAVAVVEDDADDFVVAVAVVNRFRSMTAATSTPCFPSCFHFLFGPRSCCW